MLDKQSEHGIRIEHNQEKCVRYHNHKMMLDVMNDMMLECEQLMLDLRLLNVG